MATKKAATAKKASPKKVASNKTTKPVQETFSGETEDKPSKDGTSFRIALEKKLPLDALKGIVNSAETITVEAAKESIVEKLLNFTPTQCREILEDARKELQREFEDQVTELQRQIESLRFQMY